MIIKKVDMGFLPIMSEMAEASTSVQISVKEGKAFAYLIHPTKGTVISEFNYDGDDEDFEAETNFSKFASLINSVKEESFELIKDKGLVVRFNKGKSEHPLALDEYSNFADMSEWMDKIEGAPIETVTISDFAAYNSIKSFIAKGELNKATACLYLQRDHFVAIDDPLNKSLVAMVKSENTVKNDTNVDNLFLDIAAKAKLETLTVSKFEKINYALIGKSQIFTPAHDFSPILSWFDDDVVGYYDHTTYFKIPQKMLKESLSRFNLTSVDASQQELVFTMSESSCVIEDKKSKSVEDIQCSLSDPEMEGWQIRLNAERLRDICSGLPAVDVKIHVKENRTNKPVKVQTEEGKFTFILTACDFV